MHCYCFNVLPVLIWQDYGGRTPRAQYLQAIVLAQHKRRRPWLVSRMMMITGTILKGDMSFKMAKKIWADGGGQFESIYTLMNEYGQVLGYWFCRNKSVQQLQPEMQKIMQRYIKQHRMAGGSDTLDATELGPELFYTDSCCEERDFLATVFPRLQQIQEIRRETTNSEQELLVCPKPKPRAGLTFYALGARNLVVVDDPGKVFTAVNDLRKSSSKVYGLDLEWRVQFTKGEAQRRTATVQIARDDIIYIFHLPSCVEGWNSWSSLKCRLPPPLLDFLVDPECTKVGFNINGDVRKLCRDFQDLDSETVMDSCVEVEAFLRKTFPTFTGRWSLQLAVEHVMSQQLDKGYYARFSNWENIRLTDEQQQYAAMDAAAHLDVYHDLVRNPGPRQVPHRIVGNTVTKQERDRNVKERLRDSILSRLTFDHTRSSGGNPPGQIVLLEVDPSHLTYCSQYLTMHRQVQTMLGTCRT